MASHKPKAEGWGTYVLDPLRKGLLIEDVWPCLFFSSERIPEMRRKINRLPWARKMIRDMVEESDSILTSPPQLPKGRPGWRHDFYSTTGEHLIYDPENGRRILDPVDGSMVGGRAQRAAWILLTHERSYRLMRSLAVLHRITGREDYADWVARGMSRAVDFFRSAGRNEKHHGALYFQPLYDAQVILLLADCFDLMRPFHEADQAEEILRAIFEQGSRSLFSYHRSSETHNITCYVTAAVGAIGRIMDRPELLDMALSERQSGLEGLLRHGLRRDADGIADGFWFEGTTFYHFYAMCPLFYLFELAKAQGLADDKLSSFQRDLISMARAPALLTDQKLRLPWFGDLGSPGFPGLAGFSHLYEYSAGMLDPAFAGTLSACMPQGCRAGLSALAFGPDSLPPESVAEESELLGASGIVCLRAQGKEGPFYAAFRSGRHGAGHDHFDKLGVVIHALGQVIMPDIGTAGYSLREFKEYCVSTLAHNTLMVDEEGQREVRRAQLVVPGPTMARGIVMDAYEGVVLERLVTLDPPKILLEDRFSSEKEHRFAMVFHARGELDVSAKASAEDGDLPPLREDGPFGYLRDRRVFGTVQAIEARWGIDEDTLLICRSRWDGPFECIAGTTPSNPMTSQLGTLLMRSPGRSRRVWTELEIRSQ